MADIDTGALKLGLVVGGGLLALLFAGQVLAAAARWTGMALSGAVFVLLALGAGYAATQLYAGWTRAEEESTGGGTDFETDVSTDPDDVRSAYVAGSMSEQELEAELEEIIERDGAGEDDVESELN